MIESKNIEKTAEDEKTREQSIQSLLRQLKEAEDSVASDNDWLTISESK